VVDTALPCAAAGGGRLLLMSGGTPTRSKSAARRPRTAPAQQTPTCIVRLRALAWAVALACSFGPFPLPAGAAESAGSSQPSVNEQAPRLSDSLRRLKLPDDADPVGLMVRMPEEIGTQHTMRLRLLAALAGGDPQMKADPAHRAKLRLWVESLAVLGAVRMARADA